jgi:hypothetical protein
MAISWSKTRDIISDYHLQHQIISKETGLSNEVLAKLDKNEPMNIKSLDILRKYLCKATGKNLQPSDLFEFK